MRCYAHRQATGCGNVVLSVGRSDYHDSHMAGTGSTGIAGVIWSLWRWSLVDFGPITAPLVMRVLTFALVLIAIGVQLAFMFFLLGIINLPPRTKV